MKRSLTKSTVCLVMTILIVLSGTVMAFADDTTSAQQTGSALQNDLSQLICVSKYGNTVSFPENSAEGIASAAEQGADMILVSVKKTSDGYFVLMSDETSSRMCVDSQGNTVDKSIADIGYYELATYRLRNGTGLSHEKVTAYTVPTLNEVIEKLNGKAMLLIDGAWQYRDEIYSILSEMNALNSVVMIADGSKKEISQWLSDKSAMPLVFSRYEGNVVWSSSSYIKKTVSSGVVGVILSDNNAYSTTFSTSTVEKAAQASRAVIDMTDPDKCGNRTDIPLYWDDVTSRGFSVIITNNIEQFNEYKSRVASQRERLNALIDVASKIDLTLCSTVSANNLKDVVSVAKTNVNTSVSAKVLDESYNSLSVAMESLTDRTEKDGTTFTKGRIVAAVCVIAGLIIMEMCFEHFRKKKIAARKLAKKAKKRNNSDRLE